MRFFEKLLLNYLRNSKIEMEISGFDMESFEQIVHQELKYRLDIVEGIVFVDDDIMSDTEKVELLRKRFQNDFYDEE